MWTNEIIEIIIFDFHLAFLIHDSQHSNKLTVTKTKPIARIEWPYLIIDCDPNLFRSFQIDLELIDRNQRRKKGIKKDIAPFISAELYVGKNRKAKIDANSKSTRVEWNEWN